MEFHMLGAKPYLTVLNVKTVAKPFFFSHAIYMRLKFRRGETMCTQWAQELFEAKKEAFIMESSYTMLKSLNNCHWVCL